MTIMDLNHPQHNKGAVLFVSLIILMVLTMVGLSAMNNSHVELQTAANSQEKNIANQAAQAGLNAVMCLADENSSGTGEDNPFNNTYVKINTDGSMPGQVFNWDWDRTSYDGANISPFASVTQTNCSLSSGNLEIGTGVSNDLAVAVRRTINSTPLRSEGGSSVDELCCQKYIIDSRYNFSGSGAKAYIWAGVCRLIKNPKPGEPCK